MQLRAAIVLSVLSAAPTSAQALAYATPAANYFVDATRGSDTNSGTKPGDAFATASKAMTVATTGQMVAVSGGGSAAGGVRYGESVTLPAANMALVGWQGRPLLDCSEAISAGAWSAASGHPNVYQATVTTDASITGFLSLWENGVQLTMPASVTALESTAGYFVTGNGSLTGTSQTVYVHPAGDTNPGSNGRVYEYNRRNQAVSSQYAGTKAAHLITQRNYSNNGSFEIGQNSFALDITAKSGTKHNALMHGGSTYRDFTASDSYYNVQSKILLVLNDNNPGNGTMDATFERITCTEAVESGSVCLYGHVNSGGYYGRVTATSVTTTGSVTNSIGGFVSDYMVVNGGTLGGSATVGSTLGNVLQNLTISGQINAPYAIPLELDTVTAACVSCTNGIVSVGASIAPSLNIHGSTFSNGRAFDGAIYIAVGATPTAFRLVGNTFLAPVQTNHVLGPGAANLPVASTIDGNVYHYPAAQSSWILFRGTTYDLSNLTQWNAWLALGFDATGSRVTP